jgi:thymidylate kinase
MNGEMNDEGGPSGRQSGFRMAFDSLQRAGVEYSPRKALAQAELPMEGELDIWLHPGNVPAADSALARVGFQHFAAPGHGMHRFYLSFHEGRWSKLDAKLKQLDGRRPDRLALSGQLERIRAALARRRFAGLRRLGPVVAVLGPDGAGKGSVIAGLQRAIPVAVTTFYLGLARTSSRPGQSTRSQPGALRDSVFVIRKTIRYWRRLVPAYLAAWRGHIVLCDRHPIEVLAVRPDRTKPAQAIERFLAGRLMPRPDAMILLDAPGDILFRRKGEHSTEVLERWRKSYGEVFVPLGATIVPTTGPPEAAVAQASEVVWRALERRRAW